MKKLLLVLAIGSFAACNGSSSTDSKMDSSSKAATDTMAAVVDSASAKVDSAVSAVKDSVNAKVDSLKK